MTINLENIQPDVEYFGPFSNAFRINAHTLIYWGYKEALSRITHDSHEETTITGYISESLKNRLRTLDGPRWYKKFSVIENRPMEKEGCEGKKRPMPDLVIEGNMPGRPEYIFEAKRLKKTDFGIGKYLGEDGLACFINGKYAARYDEAAMIGYIQSDSPNYWLTDIQKKIQQKESDLNLTSLREKVEVINDLPDEWMSIHARESIERSIFIYHILLDFRLSR